MPPPTRSGIDPAAAGVFLDGLERWHRFTLLGLAGGLLGLCDRRAGHPVGGALEADPLAVHARHDHGVDYHGRAAAGGWLPMLLLGCTADQVDDAEEPQKH